MIRLTTENTQKAIEKCKQLKPTVKFIKERMFADFFFIRRRRAELINSLLRFPTFPETLSNAFARPACGSKIGSISIYLPKSAARRR
jgi:hypothetical protein